MAAVSDVNGPELVTSNENATKMATDIKSEGTVRPVSLTPPRSSADSFPSESALPVTIDELFSALKDHVYKGRSIECMVISTPTVTGSSFQMVVEDSQRESTCLAIYNSTPSLVEKLVPGRTMLLLNPYVRIACNGSIMLRVDNPNGTTQHRKSIFNLLGVQCGRAVGSAAEKLCPLPCGSLLQQEVPEGGLVPLQPSSLVRDSQEQTRE